MRVPEDVEFGVVFGLIQATNSGSPEVL